MAVAASASGIGQGTPPGIIRRMADHRRRDDATATIGMVVFLASWAMLFASLFFSYGLLRARTPVWPPLDQPPLPLLLPGVNTAVAALGSGAVILALRFLRLGRLRRGSWALAASAGLGAVFLALQAVVWVGLYRAGLVPGGGPYPSVFYALTCVHALHVLVGIAALAWLAARGFYGTVTAHRHLAVRLWGMYWHFVGLVWLVLFATVYVI
jgi:cytochrome c oxidase subunit 3